MAFIDQVQDLTSLTVSDNDELSQFLKDGVTDVTNRWLAIRPQDSNMFMRISSESTSQAGVSAPSTKIISVIRESGTNDDWRSCRPILPDLQSMVTDVDSLHYASKFNPAYLISEEGAILVFPAPSSGGANSYKAYYINSEPKDQTNNAALAHSHSDIKFFPEDKTYLVVLYAGVRLLQATMGSSVISLTSVPPDVPSLTTVSFTETNALSISATAPTSISLSTISYTDAVNADASATAVGPITMATVAKADISGDVPAYTKPSAVRTSFSSYTSGLSETDPGAFSVTATAPSVPALSVQTVADFSGSAPAYTKPTLNGGNPKVSFEDFWEAEEDSNPFGDNDPGAFSLTAVTPTLPTISSQVIADPSSFAPTYTKPVTTLSVAPTISDLSVSSVPPDVPSLSTTSVSFSATAPSYTSPTATISGTAWATAYPDEYTALNVALAAITTNVDLANGIIDAPPNSPVAPSLTSVTYTSLDSDKDATAPSMTSAIYVKTATPSQTALNDYWTLSDFGDSDPGVFTMTAVSPTAPSISAQVVSDPSGDAPTYSKPTLALRVAPTISNLSISSVPPDTPSITASTVSFSTTVPSYTSPTTTINGVAWDTEYPHGEVDLTTALAAIVTNVDLANGIFDSPPDLPVTPVAPSFSTPTIGAVTVATTTLNNLGVAPTYTAPVVGGDATELSSLDDLDADNTIDELLDQPEWDQWFATAAHLIEDEEDVELAQAQLQKISAYIQAYSGAMQNQLNEFNEENAEYQGRLKEAIQQAQINAQKAQAQAQIDATDQQQSASLLLQQENQEYAASLQRYGSELQKYQAEVGAFSTQAQGYLQTAQGYANEIKTRLSVTQTKIAEYQVKVQDALNEFNDDNTEYQAQLKLSIENAKLEDAEETKKLQKYATELQQYQAEVNTEVQEYQQNLAGDLQVWQAERTTDLQKYGSDIQNELNEFSKENVKYQAILQEYIQEAQLLDAHEARKLQKYQSETQVYQSDVTKQVQEYTQKLSRYQLELGIVHQAWAKTESDNIAKYQTDIQNELNSVQVDNQANLQDAQADLQVAIDNERRSQERELQNAINDMQAIIQNNGNLLSKYSAEITEYQTELGEMTQRAQGYLSTAQGYSSEVQALLSGTSVKVSEYQVKVQDALNEFNDDNAEYQAQLQISLQNAQIDNDEDARKVQKYQAEIAEYQAEVNTEVQEYQQNLQGDLQVWQAERQTDLQKHGNDIQNELNEFNKENAKYQAILQEYIQEAQLLDAHEARKLQKYQAEVQTYQADINKDVQAYGHKLSRYTTEMNTAYTAWAKTESDNLQVFQLDIQNELNEFNRENAIYQAVVQEKIQEAQLSDGNEARKLQKYQAELTGYQADVNKEVQEYTQKLAQYQLELNTSFQAWSKTESDGLQLYSADIQNELNEFNKENARYQANVQAELAKHNSDLQKALTQAQLDAADAQQEATQTTNIDQFNKAQDQALDLANRAKQIEDDIANNNAIVARFSAQAQHYATQVNEDVQAYTSQLQSDIQIMQGKIANNQAILTKYQFEITEYQAEIAAETQEQSVKMQQYQLLYNQLKAEYDQAFMIAAPKQQAAPEAA